MNQRWMNLLDWRVIRLAEVGSTMDEAAALARQGAPAGTVVVADHQTKGRGQRGHVWVEPPGTCLLITAILRPSLRLASSPELSRTIAEKVSIAISDITGLTPTIKEPNDVLLDGRKVSGILCQSSIRGDQLEYVLVGIGLNVNIMQQDMPLESATSLLVETGQKHDMDAILMEILDQLATISGLCERVPVRAVA